MFLLKRCKGAVVFTSAICLLLFCYLFASIGLDDALAESGQQLPDLKNNQRVAVLLFHAVADEPYNSEVMQRSDLEETFQALKDNGFNPISLAHFHDFIDKGAEVPEQAVLLTFDDGYRDIYEIVYPLTKQYNYPAVSFAVSKWFGRYPRPEKNHGHISISNANELLASGLWQIGGHSYDGHRKIKGTKGEDGPFLVTRAFLEREYRLETEAEYQARIWQDINMNTMALKLAGVKETKDFAFPYGSYNDEVVKLLNEAGYYYLFTNDVGLNEPGQDPAKIRRLVAGLKAEDTIKILKESFAQVE